MTLTIDLGNTCAKLTIFQQRGTVVEHRSVVHQDLVPTLQDFLRPFSKNLGRSASKLPKVLGNPWEGLGSIRKIRWCAVGRIPEGFLEFLQHCQLDVQQLRPTSPPDGIVVDYLTPETLGADRLAAVMGAQSLQPHRTLLVIDAGTCITFDVLLSNGHYIGGNISPGADMRLKAMHHFTQLLPQIDRKGLVLPYGQNTETALRSGVIQGIRLEIMGYIAQIRAEYPDACAFLTGGNRLDFDIPTESCIFADEYLVARGLNALP